LVAVLSTGTGEYSSTLIDVSRTGIRVSGPELPQAGVDLVVCAADVRAFGQVVWSEGDACAVEFDTPIAAVEVQRLQTLATHEEEQRAP
jgi:capsid protein